MRTVRQAHVTGRTVLAVLSLILSFAGILLLLHLFAATPQARIRRLLDKSGFAIVEKTRAFFRQRSGAVMADREYIQFIQREIRNIMDTCPEVTGMSLTGRGRTVIIRNHRQVLSDKPQTQEPRNMEFDIPLVVDGRGMGVIRVRLSAAVLTPPIGFPLCALGIFVLAVTGILPLIRIRVQRKTERLKGKIASSEQEAREVASGLAHEIRNPLNAILFNLKSMGKTSGNPPLLEKTIAEIERLNSLVTRYMNFARPPDRPGEKVDINEVVLSVAGFLDPVFTENNIRVEKDLAGENLIVLADESGLRQVLMNILDNAKSAVGSDGGTIRIQTRREGHTIQIRISDNGCGMNAGVVEHIFEPFYTSSGRGTGLGLAVARKLVEARGGTIRVTSREGEGSTFIVEYPVTGRRE